MFRLVRSLRDDGTGIVFVTHRLREIRELTDLGDRGSGDGRPSAELAGADATYDELARAMVGRDLGEFFHKRDVPVGMQPWRSAGWSCPVPRYP